MRNKPFFAKTTIIVALLLLISKILAFFREAIIAQHFGTGYLVDAYLVAAILPIVLSTGIGNTISNVMIPILSSHIKNEHIDKVLQSIMTALILISIIMGVLILSVVIKPSIFIYYFARGFTSSNLNMSQGLLVMMVPLFVLIPFNSIMSAALNARGSFYFASFSQIMPIFTTIISVQFLSYKWGIWSIPLGLITGNVLQLIGLSYRVRAVWHAAKINLHDGFKQTVYDIANPFLSTAYIMVLMQANTFIERIYASTLPSGSISALNYAFQLIMIPNGVLVLSVATVLYPKLSKESKNDSSIFLAVSDKGVRTIIIFTLPIAVILMILRQPIVSIMFQRGAFNEYSVYQTSQGLLFYSLGLIAFALNDFLLKIFYSLNDRRTPLLIITSSLIFYWFLSKYLTLYIGYKGLAMSLSLSGFLTLLLYFRFLHKRGVQLFNKSMILFSGKSLAASVLMAIALRFSYDMIGLGIKTKFLSTSLSVIVSGLVYFIVLRILKVKVLTHEIVESK